MILRIKSGDRLQKLQLPQGEIARAAKAMLESAEVRGEVRPSNYLLAWLELWLAARANEYLQAGKSYRKASQDPETCLQHYASSLKLTKSFNPTQKLSQIFSSFDRHCDGTSPEEIRQQMKSLMAANLNKQLHITDWWNFLKKQTY